ncbi:MAG TPA: hypothetical protein VHR88_00125 [Solirubrobacteraceae bacterium]|nr:hypothetical protein [Solirubrobacteraceae bacterium]
MRGARFACLGLGATALVAVAAGCGGGQRQDANEPKGTYDVKIVGASFPASQQLSQKAAMKITVRNDGDRAVPNLAVTVGRNGKQTFSYASQQPGLADPQRPIWIVDDGPYGGTTAYVDTWALGRLRPHQTRTFTWNVTAVRPGTYTLDYTIAAGLSGNAKVRHANAVGSFHVNVNQAASQACVTDSGKVVNQPASAAGFCP